MQHLRRNLDLSCSDDSADAKCRQHENVRSLPLFAALAGASLLCGCVHVNSYVSVDRLSWKEAYALPASYLQRERGAGSRATSATRRYLSGAAASALRAWQRAARARSGTHASCSWALAARSALTAIGSGASEPDADAGNLTQALLRSATAELALRRTADEIACEGPAGSQFAIRWYPPTLPSPVAVSELELFSAEALRIEGLRERYVRRGEGAPLVALLRADRLAHAHDRLTGDKTIALNATLEVTPEQSGAQAVTVSLRVPQPGDALAADPSAAYGLGLSRGRMARAGWRGFFRPSLREDDVSIWAPQPYDPDRFVVLLIHGTASSPQAWRDIVNRISARPALDRSLQTWHARYPSGLPFLYSAGLLRERLRQLFASIRSAHPNRCLPPVVVVAHSMGGLVAKALIEDSGEMLWQSLFTGPPSALDVADGVRAGLDRSLNFTRLREIRRVLFIAVPHRGSATAESWFGRAVLEPAIELPGSYAAALRDIARSGLLRTEGNGAMREGRLTGVSAIATSSPLMRAFAHLPSPPDVALHNIILVDREDAGGEPTDGVVRASSAYLPGATSEMIATGPHQYIESEQVTAEIMRVLEEHASSVASAACASAAPEADDGT